MGTSMPPQGTPCWYELGTSDLEGAGAFYAAVMGWTVADSGMPGPTYHLATAADGAMVAGMMGIGDQGGAPPPNWLVYLTCDDCDATAAAVVAEGGSTIHQPTDIPGTGRFAVCADPQGAVFGVLQPAPMDEPPQGSAFDQTLPGHGNWHELMSSDPAGALAFYSKLFGWTLGEALDIGPMGTYQIVNHDDRSIGAVMGLGMAPFSVWLPYFGTDGIDESVERIRAAGGVIMHGPVEVPGEVFIAVANDPQGAWFAVVGPRASAE